MLFTRRLEIVSVVTKISESSDPEPVEWASAPGPVVVGEIGNSTASWSMDAVGETPNIAARLQTLAEPTTRCSSRNRHERLVSAAFDLQDLGLQELKGITEPLRVYRVLAAKSVG